MIEMKEINLEEYDPSKLDDKQLKIDWRIVDDWYGKYKAGKDIPLEDDVIVDLAKGIHKEIEMRKKKDKFEFEFKPERMTDSSRELYTLVKRDFADYNLFKDICGPAWADGGPSPFKVLRDVVCLSKPDKENEFDIYVCIKEPSEGLKEAIETKLSKNLPKTHKLNFIWGRKPRTEHVPLYDLKFERVFPEKLGRYDQRGFDVLDVPDAPIIKKFFEDVETSLDSSKKFEKMKSELDEICS